MGEFLYEFELGKAADVIVKELFKVKPGENFVITADSRSDERVVNATARAIYAAGAKPTASRPTGGPGKVGGALPSFQKGDMVRHKAFGQGMILSVQKMGGDALVEIAFDNVGTKRLMLKSAAAHMEKI